MAKARCSDLIIELQPMNTSEILFLNVLSAGFIYMTMSFTEWSADYNVVQGLQWPTDYVFKANGR